MFDAKLHGKVVRVPASERRYPGGHTEHVAAHDARYCGWCHFPVSDGPLDELLGKGASLDAHVHNVCPVARAQGGN